ncbi:hypothetical protein A3K63_03530 [Candidatus Micrarchaeota archaeon RBG_16_49_10]|nr:MAG: hypothetical protein A3K63_03530 [Candidatus Micrarchaeota archaeon RBG_16_49_10]
MPPIDHFLNRRNNVRLSPSAITLYQSCQRKFYYVYIKKAELKPRPALVRGSISHKVLESFFDYVNLVDLKEGDWEKLRKDFRKVLFTLLESEWKLIGSEYPDCFASEREKGELLEETKRFLDFYSAKLAYSVTDKLCELNKNSEWFEDDLKRFFYPKDRELRIDLAELNFSGVIDKTMSLFGKGIAIVDYKTSRCSLPHFIPEDHIKQGKAYAYLWKQHFNELPKHVSFYYMRTGESVYYPISEADVEEIQADIDEIRSKDTDSISDFPKNVTKMCGYCDFKGLCFKGGKVPNGNTIESN